MAFIRAYIPLDMRPPGQNQGDFEAPDLGTLLPGSSPPIFVISAITPSNNLQELSGTFNLLGILLGDYSTSTITGAKQFAGPTNVSPVEYELSDVIIPGDVFQSALVSADPYSLVVDTLSGVDVIIGSVGSDQLLGFDGDDWIFGGMGGDQLMGGNDEDFIFAGRDNDLVEGGAGDDWLKAGKGSDTLVGGEGADTFVWSGNDNLILDFKLEENDRIEIRSDIVFGSVASGADVIVNLEANASFIGGSFTLLNVDFTDFTNASPFLIV